jgi:CrcB protein
VEFLAVGLGGLAGSCLRHLVNLLCRAPNQVFPASTLIVNILASFLVGLVFGLESGGLGVPPRLRLFVVTGFLGGFSTLSAFGIETVLIWEKNVPLACLNVLLNFAPCLLAVAGGLALGRRW